MRKPSRRNTGKRFKPSRKFMAINYPEALRHRTKDDFEVPAPMDYMQLRNKEFLTQWHIRRGRLIDKQAEEAEFMAWARKLRRGVQEAVDDARVIIGSLL